MKKDDVTQPGGVEHLSDGAAHILEKVMHAGVDEGGALVGNQELIDGNPVRLLPGGEAVDAVNDLVDAGVGRSHGRTSRAMGVIATLLRGIRLRLN